MADGLVNGLPSWLGTPPSSSIAPPVDTKLQDLPFGNIQWEDFERLCMRLVRNEGNIEFCRLYGERGDDQEGIDFYAFKGYGQKYSVYQCKREKNFGPAKIKEAVTTFLDGEWVARSDEFVLCTSTSLKGKLQTDEIEEQRAVLGVHNIKLRIWDSNELSIMLKEHPPIVDDFFGRAWVSLFCGAEQASQLGGRLSLPDLKEWRRQMLLFYTHVFNTQDPGLPGVVGLELPSLLFAQRVIIPDIYSRRASTILSFDRKTITETTTGIEGQDSQLHDFYYKAVQQRTLLQLPGSFSENSYSRFDFSVVNPPYRQQHSYITTESRIEFEQWLEEADRFVLLGDPGSGKSTLLRFIAIDLLQETPHLSKLSQKWGMYLLRWTPLSGSPACSVQSSIQIAKLRVNSCRDANMYACSCTW